MTRILVVDDERASAEGLRMLLCSDGYDVVALQSAVAARDMLARESFDAVITDLEMPELHGTEIVAAARAKDPRMPILVVSAYTTSPAGAMALKNGACKLIAKPIEYDDLADVLQRALEGAR